MQLTQGTQRNRLTGKYKNLFIGGTIIISGYVSADQFHNVNQVVGDRALGMGGAYVAVSDDPAGLYYNPAGIVYASDNSISASVNTLQTQSIVYDDVLAGTYDWQRSSVQLLPNFFGVVQPFGDFKIGISTAIPDAIKENQDQEFDNFGTIDKFVINLNNTDATYNFSASIAHEVNQDFSVGLTVAYHYRTNESNVNQYIRSSDNSLEWTNRYFETVEHGIRPKLGVMWSMADKVSFGLTIDRTFVFGSETKYQLAQCVTVVGQPECDTDTFSGIQTYTNQREYPWQVRTGVAYFPSNKLLVSADVIYNTSIDESLLNGPREATLDYALGMEYYLSLTYALRAGFYTSNANTPEIQTGLTQQEPNIDKYGLTMSLTRFTNDSAVSVGLQSVSGTGKTQLFADSPTLFQDATVSEIVAFISTSYRY